MLAVSIYQTRPKSKQELQVISFNATATAVEQPAATEFGPGIARSGAFAPKSGHQQQYDIGIWIHDPKIHLRMNVTINATLLHAMMTLADQIAGN